MARAVIELSGDISPVMPLMSRAIEGCAYSPESCIAAFRFEDMRIIVEKSKIIIYGIKDETTAQKVFKWLINKINDACKND